MFSIFSPAAQDRGFLPAQNPLQNLSNQPELNELLRQMPELLKAKKFRQKIDAMNEEHRTASPRLEINREEKDLAILMLKMLANAYLFAPGEPAVNVLPAVIAQPLYALCKERNCPPVLTYSDYVLNNWWPKDVNEDFAFASLQPIFTFTGDDNEKWFIIVHVMVEAALGKAIAAVIKASILSAAKFVNEEQLMEFLQDIPKSLNTATQKLLGMKKGMTSDFFWHILRPYFTGWREVKTENKIGVQMEGIDHAPVRMEMGASGAQSSAILALDLALGIEHNMNHSENFLRYMPREHQKILCFLRQSKLHEVVNNSKNEKLKAVFNDACEALKTFRAMHLEAMVKPYIFAKSTVPKEKIIGTGGVNVEEFLGSRIETSVPLGHRRARL